MYKAARAVALGVVLGLALVGAAAFLGQLRPSLKVKNYNLVLLGEKEKLSLLATHITNDGMCTKFWLGDTLDTVVCASHLATEAAPEPGAPQGDPQPKPSKEVRLLERP